MVNEIEIIFGFEFESDRDITMIYIRPKPILNIDQDQDFVLPTRIYQFPVLINKHRRTEYILL